MLSVLFLATLLTLGQCGGLPDTKVEVAGAAGVDPTPKPTLPPNYKSGCDGFTDGICDEKTVNMIYPSQSREDVDSEAGCNAYCERMAAEYGAGCCQYGGCADVFHGRQCGMNFCTFFQGTQDVANPYSDYPSSYRGKNFKRGFCRVGEAADEATFFALTSDDSALLLARNFCAAVGLAAVFFGAYKHYFGEKN